MNMTRTIKDDLLPKLRERYARRQREGKTRMLDELCEDYGYERKYAIKLLGDAVPAPGGRTHPGPARQYERIEPVVRAIWLAAEQPCGKRLAPALPLWLPHYQRLHSKLSSKQRELLARDQSRHARPAAGGGANCWATAGWNARNWWSP